MTGRPHFSGDIRAANAAMADRIEQMPAQPFEEGGYALRVVEMRGRHSGEIIRVPLGVVQVGGQLYLISPTRDRQWVRNLRANRDCTLVAGGTRENLTATLAPADETIAAVRVYLAKVTWAASQFPVALSESDDEMRLKLDRLAVFRLLPDPPAHA